MSANCTSEVQIADVVLNKPFKNYLARHYTRWMISKVDEETEKGTSMKDIKFNEIVTQAAGPAPGWMVKAYKELGELDHSRGLAHISYNRCWDAEEFIIDALGRGAELLKEVLPKGFADSVENVFDDDDFSLMGGYLDLG